MDIDADVDYGNILKQPKEIEVAPGPREIGDTWWAHWNKQQDTFPVIAAPWAQGADRAATIFFSRWSWAAESFLLSTFPEDPESLFTKPMGFSQIALTIFMRLPKSRIGKEWAIL